MMWCTVGRQLNLVVCTQAAHTNMAPKQGIGYNIITYYMSKSHDFQFLVVLISLKWNKIVNSWVVSAFLLLFCTDFLGCSFR